MSLEARDISFSYVPGRPILHDVNLVVDPGERVALTAPSGRGKTTLCRVLSGYLRPDAGTVLVDGVELSRARAARSGVPAAPGSRGPRLCGPRPVQLIWQHPEQAFDPLMRMGRSLDEAARPYAARGPAARAAARAAGLLGRFGIRDAWLERFPHELSGGELMRFCIVRALLAEPRYLVCDEMTAMLDAVTQAEIWHEVLSIAGERDMGLVLVSHSPALVERLATRTFGLGER